MERGRVRSTVKGKRRRGTSVRPLYRTVPVRQAAPGMTGQGRRGHGGQGDTETQCSPGPSPVVEPPVVLGHSREALPMSSVHSRLAEGGSAELRPPSLPGSTGAK